MLVGRESELGVLDRLLTAAHDGHGGAIAVLGEPGVGKTAVIERAVTSANGFQVLQTTGHEGETELPFAALQQLCAPGLDRLQRLPGPQRDALGVVFGLTTGQSPDRLLVALAVLTLMSELATERPVLCVVDDAHWLDRASAEALAFVSRRLATEPVAFVFGAREVPDEIGGLPEMVLDGLGDGDARALFGSVFPYQLDRAVLDRIVAETHGNPLALLELPRGLSPAQLAGGFGLPISVPLSGRIEESFRRRLAGLPPPSRSLLLIAAADPTGDAALVWRAAERLGIADSGQQPVEAEGLVDFTAGVVFRHPLVRSAVYRAASAQERRQAHQALAEATDPAVDPDRRAWHRAQAAARPDEDVAAELELSAGRVQARGGFAAAAAFLQRSTELTVDPARRAGRALVAAEANRQAGALAGALRLAALAERGPLDDLQRAQLDLLQARISFASDRGSEAPLLLLKAAQQLGRLDARRARETYLDALTAAIFAGRLGTVATERRVAEAALARPRSGGPNASDLLLDGLALLITGDTASGTQVLRDALHAFRGPEGDTAESRPWSWLAGRAAAALWDYDSWDVLTAHQVRVARASGALTALPVTLSIRASVHMFAGDLLAAAALVDQAEALAGAIDNRGVRNAAVTLAAFRGREHEARDMIEASAKDFSERGEGLGLNMTLWATAVLGNGLARYEDAFEAADEVLADPYDLWFAPFAAVELIEAASRTGNLESASAALERLVGATAASGTYWGSAVEARSRALVTVGAAAETLYQEAIDLLTGTPLRLDTARSHLLYGEWLRRERRPREAREQLGAAHVLFSEFGMEGFSERARVELRATGEHTRRRSVETQSDLTPQERQISQLVAQGATNPEIAAQLFISSATVEYHLRKVFRKLDVKSRTQLAKVVLESTSRPRRRI